MPVVDDSKLRANVPGPQSAPKQNCIIFIILDEKDGWQFGHLRSPFRWFANA
jgi:hypothetical protein